MSDTPYERGGAPVGDEHPSVDVLADRDEGLLGADEAVRIDRHVAHCGYCGRVREQLRSVSWVLANTADESLPMPGDVAIRIDAAIVRETRQREESELATVPVPRRARQARASWSRRLLAGATIAAAVVGGGYVLMTNFGTSGNGNTSVAGPNPTTVATVTSGYGTATQAVPSATITAHTSPPNQSLIDQVQKVAAESDGISATSTPRASRPTDVGPEDWATFEIQQLPVCAAAVQAVVRASGANIGELVGTALTTYHGKPAVLVVFDLTAKRAKNGGPFDAYIVSPSCIAANAADTTTVEILDHLVVD